MENFNTGSSSTPQTNCKMLLSARVVDPATLLSEATCFTYLSNAAYASFWNPPLPTLFKIPHIESGVRGPKKV